MPRCFIAFPVGGEAKRELERVQDEIRRHDLKAPIKYTKPEDAHVTVEFLGEMSAPQINNIKKILAEVVKNYFVFDLELDHFDAYPSWDKPSVIVLTCQDDSGLGLAFKTEIDEELAKAGLLIPNGLIWRPHVTLGRVKSGWQRAGDYRRLPIDSSAWSVQQVGLFASELDWNGPKYESLQEFDLKK